MNSEFQVTNLFLKIIKWMFHKSVFFNNGVYSQLDDIWPNHFICTQTNGVYILFTIYAYFVAFATIVVMPGLACIDTASSNDCKTT